MPSWPAGVDFDFTEPSWQESGPLENVIRTKMEHGPVKTRRRFTAAPRAVAGTTGILTNAQVATFDTWFHNDIADGALSFTATNPRTGVTQTFRFTETYRVINVLADKNRIAVKLERLPDGT